MTLLEELNKVLDPNLWGWHSVGINPLNDNTFEVNIEENPPETTPVEVSKLPEQPEVCEACQ